MNTSTNCHRNRGFALVLAMVLLSLVVLCITLASALGDSEARMAEAALLQQRARLNARLGLYLALERLGKLAGPSARLTAMAGVAGVPASASAVTRHWCGVWDQTGNFLGWLTSGAETEVEPQLPAGVGVVRLVDTGSVGPAASNSEPVIAGLVACPHSQGNGQYAYWVGDEGTKVSAWAGFEDRVLPLVTLLPPSNPAASATLRTALVTYSSRIPKLLAYEQLRFLPVPTSAALGAGVLSDNFHHLSLRTRFVDPSGALVAGQGNLNTTSEIVWRAWLEASNGSGVAPQLGPAQVAMVAHAIATGLPGALTASKATNRPFASVVDFATSSLLATALTGTGVTPEDLVGVLGAAMTVRSDTFRIRAYGSARPAGDSDAEARSWCEAIVQRQPAGSSGARPRFSVTYFRWLLPSDL